MEYELLCSILSYTILYQKGHPKLEKEKARLSEVIEQGIATLMRVSNPCVNWWCR
jgi:hypothetical protein